MSNEYSEIKRMLADAKSHGRWYIKQNPDSFTACPFSSKEALSHFEKLKDFY